MKRIFTRIGIFLAVTTIMVLGGIGIFEAFAAAAPQNTVPTSTLITTTEPIVTSPVTINSVQQSILDKLIINLKNEGLPVISVQVNNDSRWNSSDVIAVILHSSSQNQKVAPEDPIYLNLVGHEANLAKQQGLDIGAIHTTLLNASGDVIYDAFVATNNSDQIAAGFNQSSIVTNDAIDILLNNSSFNGMAVNNISSSSTDDGQHLAIFSLQDQDLATANVDCLNVLDNIRASIANLNNIQGSQIAIYEIKVIDGVGNPLFNYIGDMEFGRITWWQSDAIAKINVP
jgi:hypothetical protein